MKFDIPQFALLHDTNVEEKIHCLKSGDQDSVICNVLLRNLKKCVADKVTGIFSTRKTFILWPFALTEVCKSSSRDTN